MRQFFTIMMVAGFIGIAVMELLGPQPNYRIGSASLLLAVVQVLFLW